MWISPTPATRGIKVLGIRDYGDRGVVEYVLHELTGILHGFGMPMLRDEPVETTGLKAGIIGLGVSGKMIADALQFMGADIAYYSRTRKPDAEAVGMAYKPLAQLLTESEVVFTCLNKNVLLLGKDEFAQLGAGKVLFNTSIGPGFDSAALEQWLALPGTHFSVTPVPLPARWVKASLPVRMCIARMFLPDAPSRLLCC